MKKEDYEKQHDKLKDLAEDAIHQIQNKKYDYEFSGNIVHIGLAHAGKCVEMVWEERN